MNTRPLKLLEHLRLLLSGAGTFDGAEFYVRSVKKFLLRSKNKNIDFQRESQDFYIVLRLIKEGRLATSLGTDPSRNALSDLFQKTLDLLRFSPVESDKEIPKISFDGPIRDIDWGDENLPLVEESEKISKLFRMEDKCRNLVQKDLNFEAFYTQKYIEEALWTLGSQDPLSEKSTYVEIGIDAQINESHKHAQAFNNDLQTHYYYLNWSQLARRTARMLYDRLHSKAWEGGEAKIFIGQKLGQKIISALFEALRADHCLKNGSFLAGLEKSQVFSKNLTLIDDPFLNGLTGSCLWDSEGVPAQRSYFVKNGVLTSLAHNLESAKKYGVESTGHAFIDLEKGRHYIGCHNFFLEPSHFDDVDLLKALGSGLFLEASEKPLSFSIKTGELSIEARGYWIENGDLKHAIHGCYLKTSFQELLSKIIAVGRDLRWAHHYGAPSFVVNSIQVDAVQR
jgi:PmbA protein